jgi:hypothetical protein
VVEGEVGADQEASHRQRSRYGCDLVEVGVVPGRLAAADEAQGQGVHRVVAAAGSRLPDKEDVRLTVQQEGEAVVAEVIG